MDRAIYLCVEAPECGPQASELERCLDLPRCGPGQVPPDAHALLLGPTGLRLAPADTAAAGVGATRVDFADPALRYRLQTSGRNSGLGKALGLKKHPAPLVLDATAGLGRDALLMASFGCRVLMLERSPVIHALLADGLARAAREDDPGLAELLTRLALTRADAIDWLTGAGHAERPVPDCVYLDPMFPPRSKSARVKKDIAALQSLLGVATDMPALLDAARASAARRVVVKRPGSAGRKPDGQWPTPSFTVPGKTVHYLVYVRGQEAAVS